MSASVADPDPKRAGLTATSRSLLARALALAAALVFVAALAATSARAQDAGTTTTPTDPGAAQVPTDPPADTPPADQVPTQPPPQPPADQPPGDTGPATPPADTGTSTPPAQDTTTTTPADGSDGGTVRRQPSRADDTSGATSSPVSTAPSSPAPATTTTPQAPPGTGGDPGSWTGQDTFLVDGNASGGGPTPAANHSRAVLGGVGALLFHGSRAMRVEAGARRQHETAKVSALGSGPPGPGNKLPGQNPFFNLLNSPGGIGASLLLASVLAVLTAAITLPRDHSSALRMPTVRWRPLAYVPPIELPG